MTNILSKRLTQTIAAVALWVGVLSLPIVAAESHTVSRLLAPKTLAALQSWSVDIQILDIRAKKYHKGGVIPGAVSVPYKDWRGPKERPGLPPNKEDLAARIGSAGLDLSRPIVIVNRTGSAISMGRASYVYWLLKSAGAQRPALLNGGFKAWKQADLEIAAAPATPDPTTVEVAFNYDWWADPMDIFGIAAGQREGAILDARLDMQVKKSLETGKPIMSMPFAQYVPAGWFTANLTARGTAPAAIEDFRAKLASRGIDLGADMVISVCQNGELSALAWFYASEIAGVDNVVYYPDAIQGWAADGGNMFGLNLPASLPATN